MNREPSLAERLRRRPLLWVLAAVAAVVFVIVGLQWLDGRTVRTEARETWGQRIIIASGLGVLVAEAARRWRWWLGAVALVATLAGTFIVVDRVADEVRLDRFDEDQRRPTAAGPPITTTPEPAPRPAGALDRESWGALDITLEPVFTGLRQPMAVEPIPETDEDYVLQREGEIVRIGEGDTEGDVLVDLSAETTLEGERGMFDLALGPVDGRLYVSFSDREGDNRVISYSTEGGGLGDRVDVIEVTQPFETHNGGSLEFDLAGHLLLGVGDGGRLRDPLDSGQDTGTRLGSILRIAPVPGGGYEIPPDNPLLDAGAAWPEIYAFGLRNPWRMSVDSLTGDIFIGEVGQDSFEEVDRIPFGTGGQNFGWSRTEGPDVHVGPDTAPTGFTEADIPSDNVDPIHFYPHDPEGIEGARNSITGGHVYRGDDIEMLGGTYVFADFSASMLFAVLIDENVAVDERILLDDVPAVVSLGVDHDGEILVISLAGDVTRVTQG